MTRGEAFTCQGCGETFIADSPDEQVQAEAAAFADYPDAELVLVCDECWQGMREMFPTLDARLKLEGL